MDLPTALDEIANMLSLAAKAASQLVEHECAKAKGDAATGFLDEVLEISLRLQEIGDEIRNVVR